MAFGRHGDFKDECDNSGSTETKYSKAVGIYQSDGKALVNIDRLKCSEELSLGIA